MRPKRRAHDGQEKKGVGIDLLSSTCCPVGTLWPNTYQKSNAGSLLLSGKWSDGAKTGSPKEDAR